jgi:hypothetical protein
VLNNDGQLQSAKWKRAKGQFESRPEAGVSAVFEERFGNLE